MEIVSHVHCFSQTVLSPTTPHIGLLETQQGSRVLQKIENGLVKNLTWCERKSSRGEIESSVMSPPGVEILDQIEAVVARIEVEEVVIRPATKALMLTHLLFPRMDSRIPNPRMLQNPDLVSRLKPSRCQITPQRTEIILGHSPFPLA
jgi:hypothetical protein